MQEIPEIVQRQIESQITGYIQTTGKSRELAEAELQALSFMRLKIDLHGKRTEPLSIYSVSKKKRIALIKSVKNDNWKVLDRKRRTFGEVLEEYILGKNRYYLKHSIENLPACIITEDTSIDIPEIFDKTFFETSILCSWILPYWTDVQVYTLEKKGKKISLCVL